MTSSLDSVIGQQGVDSMTESSLILSLSQHPVDSMTESKFGFCHGQQGCRLNDRIQVWILSLSLQGVDSMTSSLDSVMVNRV